ncbi:uncharacterized protein TNCV_3450501 [Trichonephila clavipes]|uniref:Uncharacterized protein n=1 Tax=Trichonephila clavipes TaxID=2585209 RepID=A0A8X7BN17_TRICX|nr:uncharacterized protein TNCV_3450501 [Trichonephila clavipes]
MSHCSLHRLQEGNTTDWGAMAEGAAGASKVVMMSLGYIAPRCLTHGLLWTVYQCKDYLHLISLYQRPSRSSRLPCFDNGTCGLKLVSYAVNQSKVWIFEDDPTKTTVKIKRAMKKVMHVVFFRSMGLIKAIKLEGQKAVTVNWYTTKCFPEIHQEVNVKVITLHHDNASSNTAALTVEYPEQKKLK